MELEDRAWNFLIKLHTFIKRYLTCHHLLIGLHNFSPVRGAKNVMIYKKNNILPNPSIYVTNLIILRLDRSSNKYLFT